MATKWVSTGTISFYKCYSNGKDITSSGPRYFGYSRLDNLRGEVDFSVNLTPNNKTYPGWVATQLEVTITGINNIAKDSLTDGRRYTGGWSLSSPAVCNTTNGEIRSKSVATSSPIGAISNGGTSEKIVILLPPAAPIDMGVSNINRYFGITYSNYDYNYNGEGRFSLLTLSTVSLRIKLEENITKGITYNKNLPFLGLNGYISNWPSDQSGTSSTTLKIASAPTLKSGFEFSDPEVTNSVYCYYPSDVGSIKGTQPHSVVATTKFNNFSFKEWNTQPDGSGSKYTAGATYSGTGQIILYAIWSYTQSNSVTLPTKQVAYITDTHNTTKSNVTIYLYSKTPPTSSTTSYTSVSTLDTVSATDYYYISYWSTTSSSNPPTSNRHNPGTTYTWNGTGTALMYANMETTPSSTSTGAVVKRGSTSLPARSATGYKFLGWATSSSATKATYPTGSSYTPPLTGTPVKLYGVWQSTTGTFSLGRCYIAINSQFVPANVYVAKNNDWVLTLPTIKTS